MSFPTIESNLLSLLNKDLTRRNLTNLEIIRLYEQKISINANPESVVRCLRKIRENHPEFRPTTQEVISQRIQQWEKVQEYIK